MTKLDLIFVITVVMVMMIVLWTPSHIQYEMPFFMAFLGTLFGGLTLYEIKSYL